MWASTQARSIGRIVGEYRRNPANDKYRLHTQVSEQENGTVVLYVSLSELYWDMFLIRPDGRWQWFPLQED